VSFRARLTLAAAAAVAVAIALASALVYVFVRDELRGEVRTTLEQRAALVTRGPLTVRKQPGGGDLVLDVPHRGFGPGGDVFLQAVDAQGRIAKPDPRQIDFPVSDDVRSVAAGDAEPFFADAEIEGTHVLQLVVPVGDGYALQLVRPLEEVDRLLDKIGLVLVLVALGGIAAAAAFGALVARTALRPVRRLTREAELVAETRDLSRRIGLEGDDELARLGSSFDTMLAALDESQRQQRQLVADASHELGTPLTSIRTNVEVLARRDDLAPAAREALLGDLVGQLGEMSGLVTGLVELASEQPTELELTDVQLDELVEDAVTRAARLAPQVTFESTLERCVVRGVPGRLERAVANVLDNAVKWSAPGATVEVTVAGGEVSVRDHGPGIADEDAPHVFDRFYRSATARAMPGSGLGLAIVKRVVDEHGGVATVERAEGGGTIVRLAFPESEPGD
jgi:two-component system, OmpR family, sensor histidine kinase MprB